VGSRRRSPQPAKFERLTFRRGFVQAARFVPGAQSVIYAASFDGQPTELFSIQPGRPESTLPLGFPATGLLSIAPNGEMAVSSNCVINIWGDCRGTLARMPLAGGAPRDVLENVKSADWTPDGKQLAVTMASVNGKPIRLEFPIGNVLFEASGNGWPGDPRISPQGDWIAFADHPTYGSDGSIAVVDLRGRKRSLTRSFNDVAGLAWSPTGREIWFTASDNNLAPIYAVTLSGEMRMVAQMPGGLRLLDIAHDGRLLLTRNEARLGAHFLGAAESRSRELTLLNWTSGPIVSSDGERVLLSESGAWTGGKTVLYIRPTDGSPAVRLGDNLTSESLSPDGRWATAFTYNQGPPRRMLVPLKAGAPVVIDQGSLEFVSGGWIGAPNIGWFPDSRRILFRAKEPGRRARTFAQDIHGGRPLPVTPEGISGTVLTSDGATLLAWDEASKAFLYSVSGGEPKLLPFLTRAYNEITFSADGRFLYATRMGETPPKVWRVDLANGRIVPWRELPFIDSAGFTRVLIEGITPDGRSLVYSLFRSLSELYLAEGLK
jgi:Tol biopolymer transport system component